MATASGRSATAHAYLAGGAGGYGANGANGGAGAAASLINAVSGSTMGGYLDLRQTVHGGAGGGGNGGTASQGGASDSSLTFNDVATNATSAKLITSFSSAYGGVGGTGHGATGGALGGAASAALSSTGANYMRGFARATGGNGGSAYGAGNGGAGASATSSSMVTSTTTSGHYVDAIAYTQGGKGGNSYACTGGAGGTASGASAMANGGGAQAYARQIGGAGGKGGGTGQSGGAGGSAYGTVAAASGYSAEAIVNQISGAGGYGGGGANGGAGAASTLINAVSGTTTGGALFLSQTAHGSSGGASSSGVGGVGGAASSSLTFNDDTENLIHASSLGGTSEAWAGAGGAGSTSGVTGGTATAEINLTGANAVTATAGASGGVGGTVNGIVAGSGGNASATSNATSTGTGASSTATANATATSGAGTGQGSANTNAIAVTANGQQATANSSANGVSGTAQTTATTSGGSIVDSVAASAQAQVGSTTTATCGADLAGLVTGLNGSNNNSYAFATGAPSASFVSSELSDHSNLNAVLGAPAATVIGTASQGAFYAAGATGSQEYKSSITWNLNTTNMSGDLVAGLMDDQTLGTGFQTLNFSVVEGGVTIVNDSFSSLASAQTFFTDHVLDLGSFTSTPDLTVTFNFDLVTSSSGSGFGEDFLLGTGIAAPVLSGGGNSANYTPSGAAVAVDAGLGVSDPGNSNLQGATIAVSAGFLAGDALNFTNQNGITGNYNASTGVLTLTGRASVANYQAALESITYSSSSSNPSNSGADLSRTISWTVTDGTSSSNTVTSTITVGETFTLTMGIDHVTGTSGNDLILAASGTLSKNDMIDGAGGTNTLQLTGGGTFDLRLPATLTNIQVLNATEGAGTAHETVYLRNGLNLTVNVANDTGSRPGISIIGANDSSTINLGTGTDIMIVGSTNETVHGGGGADTIEITPTTIGATIDGGTGASVLDLTAGGTAVMGGNITNIHHVLLQAATNFTANGISGLLINGSSGNDTITAGGSGQTLTGGAGTDTLIGWSGGGDTFLDKSTGLNGDTIQNFGASGDTIDITDIKLTGASLTFSGGTLTVTNGTQHAAIGLTGSFATAGFHAASDGHTGIKITYAAPPGSGPTASVDLLAQAAAAFGAVGGIETANLAVHSDNQNNHALLAVHSVG